ncbi:MAG TPA: hypothetical protein VIU61_07915, partial [Kofleriaceae bacterium]
APYFVLAALIHLVAIATRFDELAKHIPEAAIYGLMLVQFPLLLLSGFFESRLDHGESLEGLPGWMKIKSKPVKLAFTFACIYVCVIAFQTWDIQLGPVSAQPPKEWPTQQRAMWFAMFTVGFSFAFYLVAAGVLIPALRVVMKPLHRLPAPLGAVIALALGGGLGILVLALVTSSELGAFVASIKEAFKTNPALAVGVMLLTSFGPTVLGLVLGRILKRRE